MKKILVLIFFSMQAIAAMSQIENPETDAKKVIHLLSTLRAAPLNIVFTIRNGSNMPRSSEDTATMKVNIQLREKEAYIRFGELEQIVNDSLAIMVNDSLQQMILVRSSLDKIRNQWFELLGVSGEETAAAVLDSLYAIEETSSGFLLQSKAMLKGPEVAKETINLLLKNKEDQRLFQLKTTRRSIVLLDSTDADALKQQNFPADRIVKSGAMFYVVRESYMQINYDQVTRDKKQLLYRLEDRIGKTGSGEWRPAKAYASYQLINQVNL